MKYSASIKLFTTLEIILPRMNQHTKTNKCEKDPNIYNKLITLREQNQESSDQSKKYANFVLATSKNRSLCMTLFPKAAHITITSTRPPFWTSSPTRYHTSQTLKQSFLQAPWCSERQKYNYAGYE